MSRLADIKQVKEQIDVALEMANIYTSVETKVGQLAIDACLYSCEIYTGNSISEFDSLQ